MDLFEKFSTDMGPLGQHSDMDNTNYYMFPKLEGPISPRMQFRGKEVLTWSLNNYLGLANHPEVREADTKATQEWGLAYPMGARMMTGNTEHHEKFENDLAEFVQKESCMLLNFGYQGIMSAIDAIVGRKDVVVYDAECHACIIDGLRLHVGKRFVYLHNDMESLEKQLVRAEKLANENGGGVLVITEGVFGMSGSMGNLKGVVELKKKFQFRLLIDDAHGFGTMGTTGAGTGEEQGVQDGIDLYFSTFAKSMASIGAFIAGDEKVIEFLKYNVRSQIFAKSLPMPLVLGNQKRLDLLKSSPELKDKLWTIVNAMQKGLKEKGFNIGKTQSPVTPVLLNGVWQEAANMITDLRNNYNIFCSMIVYPVVPKGVIMLRIIPTAAHSLDDVKETITVFEEIKKKLDDGVYQNEEVGQLV
ncbi:MULTISPECIES: aminotransferase class I/II-fold pyridoxal phosphate-dependent enzyme [Reichenbachiella]|uniref:Glycine C-acetyltransferase n=1 Tax=Reichenbachiella agariperforans TaxID=156994 RepID=A0A1M6KAA6_REIAG|nr:MULTISPECIES: pyridoxal phosphate-dependent aminotransferase family protein [Reichenbachiella]MBU2913479.1 pyridoxal phosphate-dependent aminotransferase family protein [Reichenbachiella agariperforans]RJE74551.1 8-amino-7-oxononanoate synthase [Reichenbachiella sp. MSK19-1]SHJ55860.1 glycine C-acetyltransferase [Reichenbachiella agariperforans]